MSRKAYKPFGFTLVEVIAAVLIATLVIAAALGTFRRTVRNRQKLLYYSELAAHGRYGLNQIRHDLANFYRCREVEQMRLLGIAGGKGTERGDRLIINVVSDREADATEGTGDIFEVEYSLIPGEETEGDFLGRRWAPLDDPQSGNKGGRLVNLAQHVLRLEFEYFDGQFWQAQWDRPNQFPQKVQVKLELGDITGNKGRPLLISQVIVLAPLPIDISDEIVFEDDN